MAEFKSELDHGLFEDYDEDDYQYSPYESFQQPVIRIGEKVGRNDPCPCGSGKKYKKCCLNMN